MLKNLPRKIFSACVKFGGNPCRDVDTLRFYTHTHTHTYTNEIYIYITASIERLELTGINNCLLALTSMDFHFLDGRQRMPVTVNHDEAELSKTKKQRATFQGKG